MQQAFLTEAEAVVGAAYRWILGREPDKSGFENYSKMLERGEIDAPRLREILMSSDEFHGYEAASADGAGLRNTMSSDVVFIQTADPGFYKLLLETTSRTVVEYCDRHQFGYQSFIGMKRGFHPWQASFNRYYLLMDLARTGFKGWAVYMDADAWVQDLSFDLRAYLARHANRAGVLTPVAPHLPRVDVNNGVMLLNLADPRAVALISKCIDRYEAVADNELAAMDVWGGDINDQTFLRQTLEESNGLERAFHYESTELLNERDATFIRTLLRVHFPAKADRLTAITTAVDRVVGEQGHVTEMRLYPAIMSAIFRGMLNREPDEAGLDHFRSRFEQMGIERALVETIQETALSREFMERHGIRSAG